MFCTDVETAVYVHWELEYMLSKLHIYVIDKSKDAFSRVMAQL